MKKAHLGGKKWIFASPFICLAAAGAFWLWEKSTSDTLRLPNSDANGVITLEISPDSRRLLVSFHDVQTHDQISQVYDLESRSLASDLAMTPRVAQMLAADDKKNGTRYDWFSWSSDGNSIVGSSNAIPRTDNRWGHVNKIAIWDAQTGTVKADYLYTPPDNYWSFGTIRFSSDGKTLVGEGIPPAIYDVATGKRLNQQSALISYDSRAKWNENLGLIASVSNGGGRSLQVVDSKTKKVLWKPEISRVTDLKWPADILGLTQRAGSGDDLEKVEYRIWLWDGKTRKTLPSPPHKQGVLIGDFSFNPDGNSMSYGTYRGRGSTQGTNQELITWDFRANRVLWRYSSPDIFTKLQPSPDGKWLAALSNAPADSDRLLVFDKSGQVRLKSKSSGPFVRWSPDSKKLLNIVHERDKTGKFLSNRIEIHRFED